MEFSRCPLCCRSNHNSKQELQHHLMSVVYDVACPYCRVVSKNILTFMEHLDTCSADQESVHDEDEPSVSARSFTYKGRTKKEVKQEMPEVIIPEDNLVDEIKYEIKGAEPPPATVTNGQEVEEEEEEGSEDDDENVTYKCTICDRVFTSPEQHIEKYHKGSTAIVEVEDEQSESPTEENDENLDLEKWLEDTYTNQMSEGESQNDFENEDLFADDDATNGDSELFASELPCEEEEGEEEEEKKSPAKKKGRRGKKASENSKASGKASTAIVRKRKLKAKNASDDYKKKYTPRSRKGAKSLADSDVKEEAISEAEDTSLLPTNTKRQRTKYNRPCQSLITTTPPPDPGVQLYCFACNLFTYSAEEHMQQYHAEDEQLVYANPPDNLLLDIEGEDIAPWKCEQCSKKFCNNMALAMHTKAHRRHAELARIQQAQKGLIAEEEEETELEDSAFATNHEESLSISPNEEEEIEIWSPPSSKQSGSGRNGIGEEGNVSANDEEDLWSPPTMPVKQSRGGRKIKAVEKFSPSRDVFLNYSPNNNKATKRVRTSSGSVTKADASDEMLILTPKKRGRKKRDVGGEQDEQVSDILGIF